MFNHSNMKIERNKNLVTHRFQIPNLHTKKKVYFEQKKVGKRKREKKIFFLFNGPLRPKPFSRLLAFKRKLLTTNHRTKDLLHDGMELINIFRIILSLPLKNFYK